MTSAAGLPNAQRAIAQAVADSSGTATFTWSQMQCPQGYVLRGVVAITNAPATSVANVQLGGIPLPSFLGTNPFGPFDVIQQETLQVVATGLVAGTRYTALWLLQQIPAAAAGAGLPIPYSSTVASVQGITGATPVAVEERPDDLIVVNGLTISTTPTARNATAANDYGGLELVVLANLQIGAMAAAVSVTHNPSGDTTQYGYQTRQGDPTQSNFAAQWVFPAAVNKGALVSFSLMTPAGSLGGVQAILIGHPVCPPVPYLTRNDGRLFPVGRLQASNFVNAVGSTTIISAPASPARILLRSMTIVIGGTAGGVAFGECQGTVQGSTLDLLATTATATGSEGTIEWDGGKLLDVATGVTLSESGVNCICRATCDYELVV